MTDIYKTAMEQTAPALIDAPRQGRRGPRAGPLTIAERHQRLAFAAACARHSDAVVDFWFHTMMNTKAEMTHRIACSLHLMNRAHGMPVQVTHESVTENRKQILEVRWMPPDPNDRSKLIEPEPD